MKFKIPIFVLCLLAATAPAAEVPAPAIIPLPQKIELQAGRFTLTRDTRILVDSASGGAGQLLAVTLRKSTGYPVEIARAGSNGSGGILLTTESAGTKLGPEGYGLTVTPDLAVIRAPAQAGLFYGAQTLLQLLPPEIFSSNVVRGVSWQAPCVRIEDRPRFKWRGFMLDASRHFFTVQEIERLLNAAAMLKMNVFHWHLTDDHGWRLESEQYPKLTQIGAWRRGVGFGLDPKSTTAYGPDGRYGGFYTPAEVREVIDYALARHITTVPEIEMPGHSLAALAAYPQFGSGKGPYTIPPDLGIFTGIYNPADEEAFTFLENVLDEVFRLFPGKYVHLGGDEAPKEPWKSNQACQALMKREKLANEEQLQGWFMRRMESFVESRGRIPVGWSEIMQGGLAGNTVVMDWIGGGAEAARAGHDVVMATHRFCYLCYYPSLDRPPSLRAYRPFLPLNEVYSFDPIPAGLETRFAPRILGIEACLWTPDIASDAVLEEMTFPRLDALAEVGWSSKSQRNFEGFARRVQAGCQRLALCGLKYWRDDALQIGQWAPLQLEQPANLLEWDATPAIIARGKYRLSFDYSKGRNSLAIQWAALLENGKQIARDTHPGLTGTSSRKEKARDWNYFFDLPTLNKDARYTVQASVAGASGKDSKGVVFLTKEAAN